MEPSIPGEGNKPMGKTLVWTICFYKRPDLTEEAFHEYTSTKHAPLVREALVRYGIRRYSMSHNTSSTRALLAQLHGQYEAAKGASPYDMITQIEFGNMQDLIAFQHDPWYETHVVPDHENFADGARVAMSIGWVEDHIVNGKAQQSES